MQGLPVHGDTTTRVHRHQAEEDLPTLRRQTPLCDPVRPPKADSSLLSLYLQENGGRQTCGLPLDLAEIDGNGNMQPFPTGYLHMKFEDSQAVLDDYSDVVLYERGHLNPDQHQSTPHDRAATYTLTNVVPEIREFNIGPWREYEERIRIRLNNFCRGTAYIVTGVTTRGNMIRRNNQDRVAIPEDVWSAYCCTDYDRNAPHDVRIRFPTYGVLAKNAKEGNSVHEMPLQELEIFLKSNLDVDQNLQIFYDNCISPSPLPLYLQHTI
ncbi:uncharacterized protein LOC131986823 isoform X2 [Centropristis striata]|uniref:uncharacterized protein LOC131986823 isoform X2 n=1 Tax=Centropristis striata TaxID=184440 RepID=UPI0027DF45A4|nr:uncharacterized protein LOC131986823 isoform X2 [Centropristis striata]